MTDEGNWGIMVTECGGRYSPLTMAAGELLDDLKGRVCGGRYGFNYVAGKNGIPDSRIDELSRKVVNVVKRKNDGEDIDVKMELEGLGLVIG
jgi:hypothetical protein